MKHTGIPKNAKLLANRKTLAEGEKTGHAHRVTIGELFDFEDGQMYLKLEAPDQVTHEEHKPCPLGGDMTYIVTIKRQANGETWEAVRD